MLRLTLHPSLQLRIAIATAHVLTLIVLAMLLAPAIVKLLGAIAVAASAWWFLRADYLAPFVAIEMRADGGCTLQTRRGVSHQAAIEPGSFASPLFSMVRLRIEGARWARYVLVAPDSVGADDYRRLQVLLRWGPLRVA